MFPLSLKQRKFNNKGTFSVYAVQCKWLPYPEKLFSVVGKGLKIQNLRSNHFFFSLCSPPTTLLSSAYYPNGQEGEGGISPPPAVSPARWTR